MIPLKECAAVLLCAGLSRRFGPGNKLLAPVNGRPLVAHAAELCARIPLAAKIAVVPRGEPALRTLLLDFGFDLVVNSSPETGKEGSLRLGLARALALRARGVLILLGDMPHVETQHLMALSAAADDALAAISSVGDMTSPPTLMPAMAARLAVERTRQPVRTSLGRPARVAAAASMLVDYDYREQFRTAAAPPESLGQRCSCEDK